MCWLEVKRGRPKSFRPAYAMLRQHTTDSIWRVTRENPEGQESVSCDRGALREEEGWPVLATRLAGRPVRVDAYNTEFPKLGKIFHIPETV